MDRRDQSFKIETLSPSATTAEVVYGVEAAFDVLIPGGETVTLRLLQHSGLELRALKLKSKLLPCSQSFAEKYDLKPAEPCSNGQSCLRNPPAKLSLILRMDLHHVQPKLIEQFSDIHGFMAVYACSLSQKLITAGNRMYLYNEETARIALSTNSFGGATDNISDLEGDNLFELPSTSLNG